MRKIICVHAFMACLLIASLATYWMLMKQPSSESELDPDSVVLVWVDTPFPSNISIPHEILPTINQLGAKIQRMTLSPDGTLIWLLVETRAGNITDLEKLPFATNVTFAEIGTWENHVIEWKKTPKVDPLLRIMAKRVGQDGELRIYVWYEEEKYVSRTEIDNELTTLIQSIGGQVIEICTGVNIEAMIPACALDQLAKNSHIMHLAPDELVTLTSGLTYKQ